MAEFFVDADDGSDANDGLTAGNAKLTMVAGLALISNPADILWGKPGVYTGETWANFFPGAVGSRASQNQIKSDFNDTQAWISPVTSKYMQIDGTGANGGAGNNIAGHNNFAFTEFTGLWFVGFEGIFLRLTTEGNAWDSSTHSDCIFSSVVGMTQNLLTVDADTYAGNTFNRCKFISTGYRPTQQNNQGCVGLASAGGITTANQFIFNRCDFITYGDAQAFSFFNAGTRGARVEVNGGSIYLPVGVEDGFGENNVAASISSCSTDDAGTTVVVVNDSRVLARALQGDHTENKPIDWCFNFKQHIYSS